MEFYVTQSPHRCRSRPTYMPHPIHIYNHRWLYRAGNRYLCTTIELTHVDFIFYWNHRIETLSSNWTLTWTLKYSLKYKIGLTQTRFYPNFHLKLCIRIQIEIKFETNISDYGFSERWSHTISDYMVSTPASRQLVQTLLTSLGPPLLPRSYRSRL